MNSMEEKIKSIIYGLALGDSLSSYSALHRVSLMAPKRAMRMRTLGEYADHQLQTTRPSPYTHAQPGYLLNPSPSDDAEWFAFTALNFLKPESPVEEKWITLSKSRDLVRARTGTKIALRNLDQGSSAPNSGHDNPHYFDDIACIRALAAGILNPNSTAAAADLALSDAQVTHSEDGIWCAQATAVFVSAFLSGSSTSESVSKAMEQLPAGSWSRRIVEKAIEVADGEKSPIARAMKLEEKCVDRIYSYAISAPETLSLLFAHTLNSASAEELILSTYLHKRNLDSLPALTGAVASLIFKDSWIPESYLNRTLILDGICIPDLKGVDLSEISIRLSAMAK